MFGIKILVAAFLAFVAANDEHNANWFPEYDAHTVARLDGKQYNMRYSGAKVHTRASSSSFPPGLSSN